MPSKPTHNQHKKSNTNADQRQVSRHRILRDSASGGNRPFWLGLFLVIATVSIVAGLLLPRAGQAQFVVSDPPSWIQRTIRNVVDAARYISDKADKLIDKVSKKVGDVAFKNALKVFLGKIAEDTATWVASAGTGQKPLYITDPHYFRDLGDAAAGDYLDSLSSQYGVSMCDPGAFKVTLDIALRVNLNPNFCKEACQQNYAAGQEDETVNIAFTMPSPAPMDGITLAKAREAVAYLQRNVKAAVDPWKCKANGLSNEECLPLYNEAIARAEEKLAGELKQCNSMCAANKRRIASCTLTQIGDNARQGLLSSGLTINGQSTNITGQTLYTANRGIKLGEVFKSGDLPKIFRPDQNPLGMFLTQMNEAENAAAKKREQEKEVLTYNQIFPLRSIISGFIKTPGAVNTETVNKKLNPDDPNLKQTGSPVADAFGIFTNTLTSKLIERIFKKGFTDDKGNGRSFNISPGAISRSSSGVQAARDRFASISQVTFGSGGGIDILNELSGCPVDASTVTETSLGVVLPNNCTLDPSFRQAIEERLTVKEALKRGLLTDQKVFGFDANGREPALGNGYSYRSMVILRKYRIIPVGWELAAQHIRDFEKQNVNLSTIVAKFDDSTSPYYRLVDPSWVLKAPENICRRTGYTNVVTSDEYVDADGDEGAKRGIDYTKRYCNSSSDVNIGKACGCGSSGSTADEVKKAEEADLPCVSSYASTTNTKGDKKCNEEGNDNALSLTCAFITPRVQQLQRIETCVDEQTCILENDDGTCKQYGTCVQEKDIWRFNGQTCNEQYASCATFTEPAGTQVSYLQNTLQKSVCGPDNAGCQQYCSNYDYTTNKWTCTEKALETRRFDRDLQSCDPAAEGCTQFIRQTTGTNLVRNSGFELGSVINPANNVEFDGWLTGDKSQTCGAQTFTSTDAMSGSQAARLQWVPDCGGGNPAHTFTNTIETGTPLASRTFTVSFNAKSEGSACVVNSELGTVGETSPLASPTVTPEWQRFSFSYTFQATQVRSDLTLTLNPTQVCTYLLDNVQVEEGAGLTDYKDYGVVNLAHLKRPADELGCTGNTATDPAACSQFITKCSADDVGCDLFTPVTGGLNIPAKPGQSCPADKVGCETFREQPTIGVLDAHATRTGYYCKSDLPTKFTSCDPNVPTACSNNPADCEPLVSFIGTSGKQCTAQDVGCEAFTNLDEVAKGGEGKAQFTKLQQCVPLDHPPAELGNFYTWVGSEESGYQLKKFSLKRSNSDAGPCTNLGHDLPLACLDNTDAQHPIASCLPSDLGKNPDCAQYYNEAGVIFYRLRSRVIEQTADCHPYRNEVDSLTYYTDSTKSLSCSAAAVGCREYVGNTGSNTRTVLSSDFENGSFTPWAVGPISTESVNYGGHSLRVTTPNSADITGLLRQGGTYLVNFWAKGDGATSLIGRLEDQPGGVVPLGTATLGTEWNVFTLGPATVNFDTTGTNIFSFTGNGNYFIDNVVLTEVTDSTFKVKTSQTVCGGFEGCSAYRNRAGQVANLMSFSKLCKADQVGCEALINTRNSSTPFAQTITLPNLRGDVDGSGKIDQADSEALNAYAFTGGAPPFPYDAGDIDAKDGIDITDVSALRSYLMGNKDAISSNTYLGDEVKTDPDRLEYWVNDPAKACNAEDKGCRALGKQQVNLNPKTYVPTLLNTETVYAKDNPDAYPSTLCGVEALSCEEFGTDDGGTTYFRNPTGRTCEYRDATGNNSADWFVKGTNERCPIRNQSSIPPAVPTGGFAGLCPAEQNGCGTFLDPLGTGESLTANSGFEIANAADTAPQNWTVGASMREYATRGDGKAVRLGLDSAGYFTQTLNLNPNSYYVVSVDVEKNVADTNPVQYGLTGCRDAFGEQVQLYSPDQSMVSDSSGANQKIPITSFAENVYQRISGRVYSGSAVTCKVYAGTSGTGPGHWFDNLQVRATTSSSVLRQTVDSTSCNGQVGDKLGCRLFNDTSNTGLTFDVDQSPLGAKPTDADATGGSATCADQPALCDSNTILKVVRDRTCSQWLAPTTTVESTKPTGQKENLVLGFATCDKFSPSGQCNRFVDEKRCSNNPKQTCVSDGNCGTGVCKPFPLNGNTQAYSREDLRNRSGLVVAGLQFGKSCSQDRSKTCTVDDNCGAGNTCLPDQTIKGKFPFGIAPQLGGDTATIDANLFNGNFDKTANVLSSGWIMEPDTADSPGVKLSIVAKETLGTKLNVAPVAVDPYLMFDPGPEQSARPTIRTAASSLANKLYKGQTYYISFKARFMATPETKTNVDVGIISADDQDSSNEIWNQKHFWFHGIQVTDQWQTYVVGPFKLDSGATPEEGNKFGVGHDEFNSLKGSIFFSYASQRAETHPKFAIDSVSLLPVLQVRDSVTQNWDYQPVSGDVYISRSCRAYPSATAKYCSYSDDIGKQYNGWQGFCLEYDPRNPNTCLSWYPVDLLVGDRNIFGKMEAVGYNQRNPLYMCLESNGAARLSTVQTSMSVNNSSVYYSRVLNFGDYSLNEVEAMYVRVNSAGGDWWPISDTVLMADRNGGHYGCDASNCPNSSTAYTNGVSADPWFVGGCSGSGSRDARSCNRTYTWADMENLFNSGLNVCDDLSDNSNIWALKVSWPNGATGRGATAEFGICDESAGDGQYGVDIHFIVRDMCTNIIRVVDNGGQNTAWSSRTASTSAVVPDFKYKLGQDALPFGGIIAPEDNFDSPELWNTTTEDGVQPLYVMTPSTDVRAGTVYGCHKGDGSNCSSRVCSANGNACYSKAEIASCTAARGICLGAGPALTCQTGSKAGQACSVNADCGTAGVCDYGPLSGSGGGVATSATSLTYGVDRLRTLFANVYSAWTLNFNYTGTDSGSHTYASVVAGPGTGCSATCTGCANDAAYKLCYWQKGYQDMPQCDSNGLDRLSIDTDPGRAYCGNPPDVLNIAVGKTSSNSIFINSGENIQFRFNTTVDKEQQPLKSIAIDWDGDNNSDQIVNWGFAALSNPADPHSISHVYRFGENMDACHASKTGPYGNSASVAGHAYCVVRPGVQVQDNWDWCNGGRCLSFPMPGQDYWKKFGGDIVVISP